MRRLQGLSHHVGATAARTVPELLLSDAQVRQFAADVRRTPCAGSSTRTTDGHRHFSSSALRLAGWPGPAILLTLTTALPTALAHANRHCMNYRDSSPSR